MQFKPRASAGMCKSGWAKTVPVQWCATHKPCQVQPCAIQTACHCHSVQPRAMVYNAFACNCVKTCISHAICTLLQSQPMHRISYMHSCATMCMFWAGQELFCQSQDYAHDCTSSRVTARNCAWLYTAAFTVLPTAAHNCIPEVWHLVCYYYLYYCALARPA